MPIHMRTDSTFWLTSSPARQYRRIRSSIRLDSSSRTSLSSSIVLPVAPGRGQSSPFSSAPMGQRSRQPKVTTLEADLTSSGVTTLGDRSVMVIPTSLSSPRTLGLMAIAGLTPALSACQPGGAFELKSSSERTLLKVFSTQTNNIVFNRRLGLQVLRDAELVADDGPHVEETQWAPVVCHEQGANPVLCHQLDSL